MLGHFCELAALTSAGREVVCLGTSVNWLLLSSAGRRMLRFLITGRTAVITFLVMHKRYQRQGDFRCDRLGAGEGASPQGPGDRSGGTKGLNR